MRNENPMKERVKAALSWLPPTLLLSGCAATCPPCEPALPTLPPPPALTQPLPSESYLLNAEKRIETWRARLKAMPTTSEP